MPRKSPNPVIFEPDIEQQTIFQMIEQITWSLEPLRFKVWAGLLATDFMVVKVWFFFFKEKRSQFLQKIIKSTLKKS